MRRGIIAFTLMLALAGAGVYAFTFDGAPTSPLPYPQVSALDGWDVVVHQRAVQNAFAPMDAQHGADCGAPPATHPIAQFGDSVFQCRDHIMTAINGDDTGYAAIYLTPPQMLDWSAGEAVLSWDISTLVTSSRDWWDVVLTPFASNLAFPLEDWLPDGTGMPPQSLNLRFRPEHLSMCPEVTGGTIGGCNLFNSYSSVLTPSAATRTTFEARITATSLKLWLPAYNLVWYDGPLTVPFNQAVVQFGHHSYTPSKDCTAPCGPNTWHWDNITLSPSLPLIINRASPVRPGVADWVTGSTVMFPAAVAGSYLRFTSIGDTVDINTGSGWVRYSSQAGTKPGSWAANSFFVPIPTGSTSAQIRGVRPSGWPLDNQIEGVHVWALGGGGGSPSPTATATLPAPTSTSIPPTATPVPPTATSTPATRYRCQVRQGNQWVTVWDRVGGGSCP